MFSLLQQTAPAAVQTTPPVPGSGHVTTYSVPLNGAGSVAPPPAAPHPAPPPPPVGNPPPPPAGGHAAPPPPAVGHPPPPPPEAAAHPVPPPPGGPAQADGTDSIVVPNASGAADAPNTGAVGAGHAPVPGADAAHAVAAHAVPGTDAAHGVAAGGHDAAASVGMPQLDFSTFGNQIFWLLVAIALIYLILSRVAIPRLGRIVGDRQGLMTADLAAAEDFKRKARDAETAYDRALSEARTQAGTIVAANKADIDAELAVASARADAEISARAAESERRIAEIRQSAAQDARQVARDVAAELVTHFGSAPDSAAIANAVDARIKEAAQ